MASATKLITVVGDEVTLHVESEEAFAPDVEVDYQNVPIDTGPRRDPNAAIPRIFFTEKLTAVPAPLGDPPQGKVGAAIKWKVNLNNDPKLESDTAVLVARVRGLTLAGARQVAVVREQLFVQAIQVTTDPKLTRIMLHEFATQDPSGNFVFDPAPADKFVQSLSLQQKKLLCDTAMQVVAEQAADSSKPKGKLVLFITLYDQTKKARLMCADNLEGRQAIRANATFSVFHCGDPAVDGSPPLQRGIVLVLHTEFFVVNTANTHAGGTSAWIRTKAANGLTPNQYMDKANPKPLRFHVAALRPAGGSDIPNGKTDPQTGLPRRGVDQFGVIWHGFYDSTGKNIMPGNTLHGMINTHGCWMLFRNYNWPESQRNDFEIVYRSILRRDRKLTADLEFALDVLGYDVHTDLKNPAADSSFMKFASFDRNYAYLWFHHEILGIKYFSQNHVRRGKRDEVLPIVDENTRANDFEPHGKRVVKQFPIADPSRKAKFTAPDEAGFTYYDVSVRKTHDASFRDTDAVVDALFVNNALGYRVSQGFVGFVAGQLTAAQIKTRSWADVYFYRESDVDLTRGDLISTAACVDTTAPTVPPARFVRPR
jgi:hypothetical protein